MEGKENAGDGGGKERGQKERPGEGNERWRKKPRGGENEDDKRISKGNGLF